MRIIFFLKYGAKLIENGKAGKLGKEVLRIGMLRSGRK
jgi:hypothetical protein